MIAALLVFAQVVTAQTVATCRVADDPQQRVWSLERVTPSVWRIAFSARSLDKARVELPLASAQPVISEKQVRVSFASANGGRAIEWVITDGPSTLDLRVNHGLEVNIERDLDPAVESMNTEGPIEVSCSTIVLQSSSGRSTIVERPQNDRRTDVERASEWTFAAGVAKSVSLFDSTSGRAYAIQTIGWSRELTRELTLIGIRGRFAWGVEATPVFAQFDPSTIYGVGFAPVIWRWNFPPRPQWSAFAELSMGGLWTSDSIPEETSRGNFTAHWGGGIRLRPRGGHALLLAYRFQHLSNGNQLGSNPGVNSHVVIAGWSRR